MELDTNCFQNHRILTGFGDDEFVVFLTSASCPHRREHLRKHGRQFQAAILTVDAVRGLLQVLDDSERQVIRN